MIDSQAVDHSLPDQLQDLLMSGPEDVLILLAHTCHAVDVEEAPVPARDRVEVKELPAQPLVRPQAVLRAGGHVVRDVVDDQAQAGGRELTQSALAAEIPRDEAWVDDVVAVAGALARLHQRREVEVADAELAQIRHELPGLREVQLGAELQAIGGAQLGQPYRPTCFSSVTE